MRAIWIDTGPLLELTVHELGARSRGAFDRLKRRLTLLPSKPRLRMFQDEIREFGAVKFSSGSLVELHRHARRDLRGPRGDTALMEEFWRAFEAVTRQEKASCVPLAFGLLDHAELPRIGPVDAHLIDELSRDDEAWLATADHELLGAARERFRGRVFAIPA